MFINIPVLGLFFVPPPTGSLKVALVDPATFPEMTLLEVHMELRRYGQGVTKSDIELKKIKYM